MLCPDCGTELFSFHNAYLKPPAKGSRAWKKFLKKPEIRKHIDAYNSNPVKDWKTQHEAREKAKAKREQDRKARVSAKRTRAEQIADPDIEVCEVVAVNNTIVTRPSDPANQSIWFLVLINGMYHVYNTTSLREVFGTLPAPKPYSWSTPPPVNPFGAPVGPKCKLSRILKRRLNSAIRKFVR